MEAKHQKYKGRVVLRGDIVKDDSRFYAVYTEQGSSASQMLAASRGYRAGQAADAVPACTQEFPNRNVQTCGFVYHETKDPNHGPVRKTQSFLLKAICMVILLAGVLWERQLGENPFETWLGESSKFGMSLCAS